MEWTMARRKHGYFGSNSRYLVYVAFGMVFGIMVAMCTKHVILPCGMGLPECCSKAKIASHRLPKTFTAKWTGQNKNSRNDVISPSDAEISSSDHRNNRLHEDQLSKREFLLIGVMTAQKYLDTRAISGYRTWVKTIPGKVIFFSSEGSKVENDLPLVALPGVDDSYPPQKKSFMMLKYMHDHFIDKYSWFVRADDDVYIRGEKLEKFLRSVNSSKPQFIGQAGIGMKEEIGRLSLDVDENFCMGGPGVVFSRETLSRVAAHTGYCLKHFYSTHEDVEVGRCVRRFAGIPCTWAFEMQHLFYHNYREEKGSFTHSLTIKEVNRAITLHPVKEPRFLFRMHSHFKSRRIMELSQRQLTLQREIASLDSMIMPNVNTASWKITSKQGLQPSLNKFIPHDVAEVLAWEFLAKAVYSHKDANPARGIELGLHHALNEMVMQIMTMVNKNARQRGRTIDFKEILYGYRRTNPLYGADYVLDLLLVYRKHKGRKMTVPVRRHAYLHQTFAGFEFKEESKPLSIESPVTQSPSLFDTVRNKLGFSRASTGRVPSVHQKEIIDFILPLAGRYQIFERFMENYENICLKSSEPAYLHVILYKLNDGSTERTIALVQKYQKLYPTRKLQIVMTSGSFSRGAGLNLGLQQCRADALLFFVDVDIHFTKDTLDRIRLNTKHGKCAYFPIVFSQYDPETIPSCANSVADMDVCGRSNIGKTSMDYGYWRQFGFGIASLYKSDFVSVGGFDKNIHGWGKEDVDLYQKLLSSNVTVFRSVDLGLVHVFHPIKCDPDLEPSQYQMCTGSKASSYGSVAQLADIIRKTPDIRKRRNGNSSQGREPS